MAVDRRDPKLRTSISVNVHLAETSDETCKKSQHHEVMWPQTYRVKKLLAIETKLLLVSILKRKFLHHSDFAAVDV